MDEHPLNDTDLVARLRLSDEGALARLYDEYGGMVYGIAKRVLRSGTAAEDIVQEVFLQLWRNPAAFDGRRGLLAPWLAVVARRKAVDVLRKRKCEVGSEEPSPPEDPTPATDFHFSADADKAKKLMAKLPVEQRQVLEMAFLDGLTHAEIAIRVGEPLGTVKSRIRLGLLFLRREMAA